MHARTHTHTALDSRLWQLACVCHPGKMCPFLQETTVRLPAATSCYEYALVLGVLAKLIMEKRAHVFGSSWGCLEPQQQQPHPRASHPCTCADEPVTVQQLLYGTRIALECNVLLVDLFPELSDFPNILKNRASLETLVCFLEDFKSSQDVLIALGADPIPHEQLDMVFVLLSLFSFVSLLIFLFQTNKTACICQTAEPSPA